MSRPRRVGPVIFTAPDAPQPTAILTRKQLAAWIGCSVRTVARRGYPHVPDQPTRYLVQDVLDYWRRVRAAAVDMGAV